VKSLWIALSSLLFIALSFNAQSVLSSEIPDRASLFGKYSNLKQILKCRKDRKQYGQFKEFGYWGGGAWCGTQGKSGYWVWLTPNWYVWANKGKPKYNIPDQATVNGKYSGLKQILSCKPDRAKYGNFKEFGYWDGGRWCGNQGKAGFWVWVYPAWYVWQNKH